jgi:predicted  nucleic acid-binding Zn-ribbon protein
LGAKDARIRDLEPNFSACYAENSQLLNQVTMGTCRIAELESQFTASDARAATMEPQLAGKDERILTLEAELAEAKSTIRDKTRRATGGGSSVGGKRQRKDDEDSDDEPVITHVTRVDAPVATYNLLEDDQVNDGGA